jgi:ATP-dependent DNA helicase DinG
MSECAQSEFMTLVESAFSGDGVLARNALNFSPRLGQTQMALAVAQTMEQGGSLVVEAGTGVGKTFAYLIPALLSGERVLLSTATKALQDQLFSRDLPHLVEVLGLPIKMSLLKGRSSYLCQQRLGTHAREHNISEPSGLKSLSLVKEWAKHTQTGDLSEIGGLEERSSVIPLITSSRDNCLGSQCPQYKACYVNNARKEALASDVVVINHHLFFADLAVKESGMAELLPSVRVVVFDEAHQLNETGTQFLGEQLGLGQLLDLIRDILASGLTTASGLCDWQGICSTLEKAVRDFRLCIGAQPGLSRLRWTEHVPDNIRADEWDQGLESLTSALLKALEALATVSEIAPEFPRLHERVSEFIHKVKHFSNPSKSDQVRWLELSQMPRLVEAPLDISDVVREKFLGGDKEHNTANDSASVSLPKSWIFTSATLGSDEQLSWFTKPCGLESSHILKVQSPFDYPNNALLFIPKTMVKPSDPSHSSSVAELSKRVIDRLRGRTLILTTTNRAMKHIADALNAHYENSPRIEVMVQGQLPKRYLMDRFRSGATGNSTGSAQQSGERGFVLVATASFWEGFDVPGNALQAVIIDKLPFPPPGDPLVEARCNRIEQEGGSAFNEYSLPEVAVALKQGAGRLIRGETDKGVLVICDSRLMSTGYGRKLIKTLPPMKHEENSEGLFAFIDQLLTQ